MKTLRSSAVFLALTLLLAAAVPRESQAQGSWVFSGRTANAWVKILNRSADRVRIYTIDRWGRWSWAANLDGRSEAVLSSPIGEEWLVTDLRNRVLDRVRARSGVTTLEVGANIGGGRHDLSSGIKFRNRTRQDLFVFRVNNWGGWDWSALLPAGGESRVVSDPGRTWFITTRRGVVVKKTIVEREPKTVDIGD